MAARSRLRPDRRAEGCCLQILRHDAPRRLVPEVRLENPSISSRTSVSVTSVMTSGMTSDRGNGRTNSDG